MKGYILLLSVVLAVISLSIATNEGLYEKDEAGRTCVDNGPCARCTESQLVNEDVCKETGLRMPVLCDRKVDEFRSCDATPEDEQVQVMVFQLIVALLGGLSFWGVKNLKDKSLSMFDARKRAAKSYLPV